MSVSFSSVSSSSDSVFESLLLSHIDKALSGEPTVPTIHRPFDGASFVQSGDYTFRLAFSVSEGESAVSALEPYKVLVSVRPVLLSQANQSVFSVLVQGIGFGSVLREVEFLVERDGRAQGVRCLAGGAPVSFQDGVLVDQHRQEVVSVVSAVWGEGVLVPRWSQSVVAVVERSMVAVLGVGSDG